MCYQMEKHLSAELIFFTQVRGLLYKHITDSNQKFLANYTLCCREKANVQAYTPSDDLKFQTDNHDKIAIDLITECKTSNFGNKLHVLQ